MSDPCGDAEQDVVARPAELLSSIAVLAPQALEQRLEDVVLVQERQRQPRARAGCLLSLRWAGATSTPSDSNDAARAGAESIERRQVAAGARRVQAQTPAARTELPTSVAARGGQPGAARPGPGQ